MLVFCCCDCYTQQHYYQFGHADISDVDTNWSPPWGSMGICHADDVCLVGILNITFGFSYSDMNILYIFTVTKEGTHNMYVFLKLLDHAVKPFYSYVLLQKIIIMIKKPDSISHQSADWCFFSILRFQNIYWKKK